MNWTAACAFALSISLASLGAPADAAEPVEEAIADWVAQIDAAPDWSARFASLDYDSAGDTATVTGLTVEYVPGGFKISFDPVSISGYSESGDGTFSAESVSGDGMTIAAMGLSGQVPDDVSSKIVTISADISGRIADFRLEGLGNIATDFAGGIEWDPQKPFTSMVKAYSRLVDIRLAQGTFGELSFGLMFERDSVPGTYQASYKNLVIEGWADGKVASISIGSTTSDMTIPDGTVTTSIASTLARGIDYSAIMRVLDPDQYVGGVGDRIWRNATEHIEIKDMSVEMNAKAGEKHRFRQTTALISMEDFRVRQPARSANEFLDRALLDPGANDEPTPEELRAALDYLSSFSVGAIAARENVFEVEADDGGGVAQIGGIAFRDVSFDGIGEFSINDFTVRPQSQGLASIGRIALGDLVFPPLEALVDAAEAEETGAPFDYSQLSVRLGYFETLAVDVNVPESPRFKLDKARLDLGNYVGPIPTLLALEIAGADLPLAAIEDPRLKSTLQTLGYDRVRGDFTAKLAWNEADQSVAIDDVRFALADVGAVSLNALLVGLPRAALDDLDSLPDALIGMSFVEGGLALENYAVLDRWIDQQSAATGVEESQLRQQVAVLLTHLTTDIGNAGFRDQLQRAIVAAVTTPGPITVTATPVAPVPLAALAVLAQSAPANLPELLGVTIEQSASGAPGGR